MRISAIGSFYPFVLPIRSLCTNEDVFHGMSKLQVSHTSERYMHVLASHVPCPTCRCSSVPRKCQCCAKSLANWIAIPTKNSDRLSGWARLNSSGSKVPRDDDKDRSCYITRRKQDT